MDNPAQFLTGNTIEVKMEYEKSHQSQDACRRFKKKSLFAAVALGVTAALPAAPTFAQEGRSFQLEEIVVTARRREERLQDVPVSMTVLSQDQMHNHNVTNAADIAVYTPSLHANPRFGSDSSTFAIRGFSQELRTTSSVGVYFAEVVSPRGANTTQSGDGAGPGDFFDLENVQVLKGPQGTLFGRNTTGGAVLLTPKKPTDELEGYIEGSAGNYDMHRVQGVINVPVADNFRMRFGVDHQKRDGYLKNISDIGPGDFEDMDYIAARASFVWDITDRIENYTIVKYSESETNGSPYSIFACNADGLFGSMCQADLNRRAQGGNDGFYDVYSFVENSKSEMEQWQVINTTTIELTDNLTLKNILSYAEFESRQNYALYGTDWRVSEFGFPAMGIPVGVIAAMFPDTAVNNTPLHWQMIGSNRDIATTQQKSFVEELQLQGRAFDDRLTWQAGVYYEKSKPDGDYGSINPSQLSCDLSTVGSSDPSAWACADYLRILNPALGGSMLVAPGGVTYENQAVYAQGTWEFNDQWSATVGLRYTKDETKGWVDEAIYFFPPAYSEALPNPNRDYRNPKTTSEEPTWMVGVDYRPMDDVLLYAKYARGYRQGSVNLASVSDQGLDVHGPEEVDTYEIGAKTSFYGRFPGTFNISAFYNDFKDQQIQFGYFRTAGTGSTSIVNAGASTIWGLEIEGNVFLTDNLSLAASYAYLDTEIDKLQLPDVAANPGDYPGIGQLGGETTAVGEPLSYAPKHNLVLTATYRLPIDEALGDMSVSATYSYTDKMQAVARSASQMAVLPSYEVVNFNFNWRHIMGGPFDVSAFVTNLTNEKYKTYLTGNWNNGLEAGRVGPPRMYGARIRYNF